MSQKSRVVERYRRVSDAGIGGPHFFRKTWQMRGWWNASKPCDLEDVCLAIIKDEAQLLRMIRHRKLVRLLFVPVFIIYSVVLVLDAILPTSTQSFQQYLRAVTPGVSICFLLAGLCAFYCLMIPSDKISWCGWKISDEELQLEAFLGWLDKMAVILDVTVESMVAMTQEELVRHANAALKRDFDLAYELETHARATAQKEESPMIAIAEYSGQAYAAAKKAKETYWKLRELGLVTLNEGSFWQGAKDRFRQKE